MTSLYEIGNLTISDTCRVNTTLSRFTPSKGEVLVMNSNNVDYLPAGTNGYILTYDNTQSLNLKWAINAGSPGSVTELHGAIQTDTGQTTTYSLVSNDYGGGSLLDFVDGFCPPKSGSIKGLAVCPAQAAAWASTTGTFEFTFITYTGLGNSSDMSFSETVFPGGPHLTIDATTIGTYEPGFNNSLDLSFTTTLPSSLITIGLKCVTNSINADQDLTFCFYMSFEGTLN